MRLDDGSRPIRRAALFVALMLAVPATASAVTLLLQPDGPTTFEVGQTLNVDVFMVLDASDQAVGISAAVFFLEGGMAFVSVTSDHGAGSPFPTHSARLIPPQDFIAFSQFGATVTSPEALLGTIFITGVNPGSYDLVARRFGNFPLFTAPGVTATRYDFASDETLPITVAAVPEVGTLVLLGASLAGLAFRRSRSRGRYLCAQVASLGRHPKALI
jgi:hypothetical protein